MSSGCCTGPETFHERCLCFTDKISCKKWCDEDINCKGYAREKGGVCHLATNSTCPQRDCERQNIGERKEISAIYKCGSDHFEGCHIKQKGFLLEYMIS